MMKKRFFSALLCLCLLIGLVPGAVTTAFAASQHNIGDTVWFAGHEWYVIGTETDGVTAPAGCYTLFAKNNEFGTSTGAFQSYRDSELCKKIEGLVSNDFADELDDIEPRTLIAGEDDIPDTDPVTGQYLWPLSESERKILNNTTTHNLLLFNTPYWLRSSIENDYNVCHGHYVNALTGNLAYSYSASTTYAIRPALYVKQEAIEPDLVVGANAIRNAQMGVNFEQSTGTDTPLIIDDSLKLDVRMEESQIQQRKGALDFRIFGDTTTTGPNRVVSAVLTDDSGNVKYYGKFRDCSGKLPEKSDFSISMGEVTAGTYTLSIFLHDTETNRISELSPTMKVEIGGTIGTITEYNGQTYEKDLAFTQHPQNQIVYTGSTATFSAEAEGIEGINIEYTWQAQPKSSDPETGKWYDIMQLSGVVQYPYKSKTLEFTNPSGSWDDNSYHVVSDLASYCAPADTRFRCVATDAKGRVTYSNPADLTVIPSGSGEDGREVELRTTDTHIQWRYVGEGDDAWRDLVALDAITGGDGADGADGREVELQIANGYIQWRYTTGADTAWKNLMPLSDLKGEDGEDGDTPYIGSNGNWWIGTMDTGVRANGKNGSSGSDGSDGRDGRDGKDGEDGEDGLTPFIGSNGNWWIGAADTGVPAAGTDGAPGRDGVGISGLFINEAGELVITLTDGTENNLGRVTGEDGAGIAGISISEAGELIVTLTDGTELNAGAIPTDGPEMSCLRLLVYLALGMSALSLTGLLVAGGLWYRRHRASRS